MTARQRHAVRGTPPWGGATSPLEAFVDLLKTLEWQNDAACRDVGGDAWYPEERMRAPIAKSICEGCPVRTQCLEDALERHDQHGIWGGYSVEERREMQRQRAEVAA
jgi:WhiB family redox-sensing transcriptional regulator